MNYKEIKEQVETCDNTIKSAKEQLKILREKCDHPEIKKVAPGCIPVCQVCGEVLMTEEDLYWKTYME